jgi:hypothetical protein
MNSELQNQIKNHVFILKGNNYGFNGSSRWDKWSWWSMSKPPLFKFSPESNDTLPPYTVTDTTRSKWLYGNTKRRMSFEDFLHQNLSYYQLEELNIFSTKLSSPAVYEDTIRQMDDDYHLNRTLCDVIECICIHDPNSLLKDVRFNRSWQ